MDKVIIGVIDDCIQCLGCR